MTQICVICANIKSDTGRTIIRHRADNDPTPGGFSSATERMIRAKMPKKASENSFSFFYLHHTGISTTIDYQAYKNKANAKNL